MKGALANYLNKRGSSAMTKKSLLLMCSVIFVCVTAMGETTKTRKEPDQDSFSIRDKDLLSIIGVQVVLYDMLPANHFVEDDDYFGLMTELLYLDIKTIGALRNLIRENRV